MSRRFERFTGASLRDGIEATTLAPARLLGIDERKGSLSPGKDADLVLLDAQWGVALTMVEGRIVHDRDGLAASA